MTTVSAYQAKTQLSRLIRAAERGETVIITRHGRPVAKLAPVEDQQANVAEVIERMKRARGRGAPRFCSRSCSLPVTRAISTDGVETDAADD